MLLLLMACRREIPATVSITADTGWESDRKWSNGRRTPSSVYFDEIVVPLAVKHGIIARFVRSRYKTGNHFESLIDHVRQCAIEGKKPNIPMFGSRGGRLRQVCTDKWKIRALRQDARTWFNAKTNCNAQGIHKDEADRRVSGRFIKMDGKWSIYQTTVKVKGVERDVKWQTHYYPLVDLRLNRNDCQRKIVAEGIPYLLSSECDGCPHKDAARWFRTSFPVLKELAAVEAMFNGELFFTSKRIPLLEAISEMQHDADANPERYKVEADFGCQNAICGI
jgi:hypothetical protein